MSLKYPFKYISDMPTSLEVFLSPCLFFFFSLLSLLPPYFPDTLPPNGMCISGLVGVFFWILVKCQQLNIPLRLWPPPPFVFAWLFCGFFRRRRKKRKLAMDLLFVSVIGMCFASSKYLLIFKWHFIYHFAMNFFFPVYLPLFFCCVAWILEKKEIVLRNENLKPKSRPRGHMEILKARGVNMK